MSRFRVPVPQRAFHGAYSLAPLIGGMPSAATCKWFTRVEWRQHDSWMNGGSHPEEGIPYANILWEAVGLRDRRSDPEGVAHWARDIASFQDLADRFGMLFFTDRERDAHRYGECAELDLNSHTIVDVVEDPHVRTHNGWIAIIPVGAAVPFVEDPTSEASIARKI